MFKPTDEDYEIVFSCDWGKQNTLGIDLYETSCGNIYSADLRDPLVDDNNKLATHSHTSVMKQSLDEKEFKYCPFCGLIIKKQERKMNLNPNNLDLSKLPKQTIKILEKNCIEIKTLDENGNVNCIDCDQCIQCIMNCRQKIFRLQMMENASFKQEKKNDNSNTN